MGLSVLYAKLSSLEVEIQLFVSTFIERFSYACAKNGYLFYQLKSFLQYFPSQIQLCYVLPKHQHSLLPLKFQELFKTNYHECFVDTFDYRWAFCRYLWEAHPILPPISTETLTTWMQIS